MNGEFAKIVKDHYGTYVDDRNREKEEHRARLVAQVLLGVVASLLSGDFTEGFASVIITSLSVLAGFSFSAMFPVASDIRGGLPPPEFPEDHDDLARISDLAGAFRANVSYFIPLTLMCILLFLVQIIEFRSGGYLGVYTKVLGEFYDEVAYWADLFRSVILLIVRGLSVFAVLEVLYTFYRMCSSVLYILRIKEEYRTGHNDNKARDRR